VKDRTEYLVLRKFPFARAIDFPPSLNATRGRDIEASPQLRESLAAYRAELASLSSEELARATLPRRIANTSLQLRRHDKKSEGAFSINLTPQPILSTGLSWHIGHWTKPSRCHLVKPRRG
jgi:hypothetical protein